MIDARWQYQRDWDAAIVEDVARDNPMPYQLHTCRQQHWPKEVGVIWSKTNASFWTDALERRVVQLYRHGKSHREISCRTGISETMVRQKLRELGVVSRTLAEAFKVKRHKPMEQTQ